MSERLAFLVLLLLNVVLFAWGYQRQLMPRSSPPAVSTSMEGSSIQILSEAGSTPVDFTLKTELAGEQNCIRLGPISLQQTAVELLTTLEQIGNAAVLETETTSQKSGFWVVMVVDKGKQPAVLMAELNEAGVLDVWLFDKGPLAGMISLGLYSDLAKAEKRRNFLSEKGFNAQIQSREIEVPSYWVRTNYAVSNKAVQRILEQFYQRYPELTFPPPVCSA